MSAAPNEQEAIPLRTLAESAQSLSLADQMTECVSLLQAPEILLGSLMRSVDEIRDEAPVRGRLDMASSEGKEKGGFFYPSRELFVQGDCGSFTCLATAVGFGLPETGEAPSSATRLAAAVARGEVPDSFPSTQKAIQTANEPKAEANEEPDPEIDFAAITCEARPFPLLGFTPGTDQESAYSALIRGLASIVDLTRPRRFDLLDREVYRGLLGPAPVFDLALVLWDDEVETDPRRPLCELTRDLAELLKRALGKEPRFPPVLNDIVCLRMNPKRFDARLRFVWRV